MKILNWLIRFFKLFFDSVKACWDQLWKSFVMLVVLTVILATVFYLYEAPQQEEYANWWQDLRWAFFSYIGDPGGFGGDGPVTFQGRVIATLLSIVNILIFAVPAGIIASGFSSALEEDAKEKQTTKNCDMIRKSFRRALCRYTSRRCIVPYQDIPTLQANLDMTEQDIIEAVQSANDLRLRNIAGSYPLGTIVPGSLVVEYFMKTNEYGNCIDRGSNITIVCTSGPTEYCLSWFAWYVAKFGGFNFVSKEIVINRYDPQSWYILPNERTPLIQKFIGDISNLASKAKSKPWVICLLTSAHGQEPQYPTQVHFSIGGERGNSTYEQSLTFKDVVTYDAFHSATVDMLEKEFNLLSDQNQYHFNNKRNLLRHLNGDFDGFTIRIDSDIVVRDSRRLAIAKRLVEMIHLYLDPDGSLPTEESLREKGTGY